MAAALFRNCSARCHTGVLSTCASRENVAGLVHALLDCQSEQRVYESMVWRLNCAGALRWVLRLLAHAVRRLTSVLCIQPMNCAALVWRLRKTVYAEIVLVICWPITLSTVVRSKTSVSYWD
jgi:hypothetical protein